MLSMKLNRYWIENVDYKLNPNIFDSKNKAVQITPELQREIVDIDDNNAIVKLSILIEQSESVPFGLKMTVCGSFECEKWKESDQGNIFIKTTSIQVLFPYLRNAVSMVTGLSNVPQYVLPIINVLDLFK